MGISITTVTLANATEWIPLECPAPCNGFSLNNKSASPVLVASDPADPQTYDQIEKTSSLLIPAAMARSAIAYWESRADMWRFRPGVPVLHLQGTGSFPQTLKIWWVS